MKTKAIFISIYPIDKNSKIDMNTYVIESLDQVQWEIYFLLQITDLYISDQVLCDCSQNFEKVSNDFLSQSFKSNFSQSEGTSVQIWIFRSRFYLSICLFKRISLPKTNLP